MQMPFGFISIDPTAPLIEVHHGSECTVHEAIAKLKAHGHKVLFVENPIDKNRCIRYVEFCSCVTVVKQLLGFHHWAQTPYQLYKALLKAGAKEM
jgi:hypothetical protein